MLIVDIMWLAIGFVAFLEIVKLISKHFGECEPNWLMIPLVVFSLLGGFSAIIAIHMWLAWEWDGRILK